MLVIMPIITTTSCKSPTQHMYHYSITDNLQCNYILDPSQVRHSTEHEEFIRALVSQYGLHNISYIT